jgi:hypothetical protein
MRCALFVFLVPRSRKRPNLTPALMPRQVLMRVAWYACSLGVAWITAAGAFHALPCPRRHVVASGGVSLREPWGLRSTLESQQGEAPAGPGAVGAGPVGKRCRA